MNEEEMIIQDEMILADVPLTELELLEMISGALIEINWKITIFIIFWLVFKMWGGSRKL